MYSLSFFCLSILMFSNSILHSLFSYSMSNCSSFMYI